MALVVIALVLLFAGASTFFFVQINQQVEKARGKVDEGMVALRKTVDQYPALRSAITSTPFLSNALELESGGSEKQSGASQEEGENSEKENQNQTQNTTENENQKEDEDEKESEKENQNEKESENENEQESAAQSGMQLDSLPKPHSSAGGTIGQMFKTTFGLVVNSILIFFVGLFLATSPNTYRDGLVRLVPQPKRERITEVLDATGNTLWRWLIGRFASMLAIGGGAFLLVLALGVPMAATLGILTGLLTFVPNIGAAIALLLSVVVAMPQGAGTVAAVVGGYLVLQLLESYLVTPLIEQKAVSLPPALVIAFQAVMSVLFGFIGAAVASPLLAAGKTIVEMMYIQDHLESNESA